MTTTALPIRCWLFPIFIAAIGLLAQSATFLNHDVAWVLQSSGRLLDGGVFGRDIVAANPPLIWWLSSLPRAVSTALDVSPELVFRLFVSALAAIALVACEQLMRAQVSPPARAWILGLASYVLFIGVNRDFGQREHLTLILVLPYLLAIAHRIRGGNIRVSVAILIGVAASLGVLFKPHLLAVPVIIEVIFMVRRGAIATLVRPEAFAALLTALVYCAAILVFAGPYLTDVIPEIRKVYWGFSSPLFDVLASKIWLLGLLLLTIYIAAKARWLPETTILSVAACGFFIAAIMQSKNYSYHFYPVLGLAILALATAFFQMPKERGLIIAILGGSVFLSVYQSAVLLKYRSSFGEHGQAISEMVEFVRTHVPQNGRFLALATHPYPGFPTALYAEREWSAASNSRIFLPAIVRLRNGAVPPDQHMLEFAEDREHATLRRDATPPPDLILVDARPFRHAIFDSKFDFLEFYNEDPWFREFLRKYRILESSPVGFHAFVLSPDPSS